GGDGCDQQKDEDDLRADQDAAKTLADHTAATRFGGDGVEDQRVGWGERVSCRGWRVGRRLAIEGLRLRELATGRRGFRLGLPAASAADGSEEAAAAGGGCGRLLVGGVAAREQPRLARVGVVGSE